MMKMKGKDVYWEVHPPFLVSRMLGVAPVDEWFSLDKGNLVLALAVLGLTTCIGLHVGLYIEGGSGFNIILQRTQNFIIILTVVVSSIKSIANVTTLSGVMKQLASLDKKLYDIGILLPYSRVYGYTLTALRLTLILSLGLPELVDVEKWNLNVFFNLYNVIVPLLVGNIVQVQFMVLLELVQRRVRILTDRVKDIGKGNNVVKASHLHVLVSVHSSLISICETVNNLYSFQILIILSSIFIVTTANLYNVIANLMQYNSLKKEDFSYIGMTTYGILVRSLEVWTLATTCVNTQDLAKDFNVNLYQVMIEDKTNEISENKKLRLHISMNRDIIFTAAGFFLLDYTLVHSMIAAATTYLVILIQFGQSATQDSTSSAAPNVTTTSAPNTTVPN